MKKTLIKIIPLLLGTTLVVGCSSTYSSKSDKKENFVGLYELDVYKSKRESSEEEPYDRKTEEGITAYFTIDLDGYGYYGYKDNANPARVDQVFWTFVEDEEQPGSSIYFFIDIYYQNYLFIYILKNGIIFFFK